LPAEKVALTVGGQLSVKTPKFANAVTNVDYPLLVAKQQFDGVWTAFDNNNLVHRVSDNNEITEYVSNSVSSCFITLDNGDGARAEVTEIRYVPAVGTASNAFNGLVFDGSNDGSAWTTLYTTTASNDGYNYWQPTTTLAAFRYLRVRAGTSTGKCRLAEVQYFGYLSSADGTNPSTSTTACPIRVNVRGAVVAATPTVNYQKTATPVLYDFSPKFGTSAGDTIVTLVGNNFGASPVVKIDDSVCAIQGVPTATQIVCKTAAAPSVASRRNSFDSAITISFANGNAVTNNTAYFYVDLWSSVNTWSGITPPRNGDSVYIPAGQNVLVDSRTNTLKAVVIQGGLFFDAPDGTDFIAKYILINGGRFQVGTAAKPYDCAKSLTITLEGLRSDPSLPIAGNKMIANINGVIDIHGCKVNTPWTKLAATAAKDATSITVVGNLVGDWKKGDTIVLTSTSHSNAEQDEVVIESVTYSAPNSIITFKAGDKLSFKHYSDSQLVGKTSTQSVTFSGEVGLLSRNVVVQGDEQSQTKLYGVNIISFSQGTGETITRISSSEIRYTGQAYLVGRYAIYYRMIGSASRSYLRSNSIHHSYNRAVSIHATHYLKVENNFIYQVMGHAIYLEDGIETNNQITGNLVARVVGSRALLLTDQIPACVYITNPSNTINNNVCAGSDGQGFWFMLPQTPMGASYCQYVCPQGVPLGSFDNNEAHSTGQNGLRIFPEWIPRANPCSAWVNWAQEANPFAVNTPIQASLNDFKSWKNGVDGIAAEKVGAILFNRPIVADNKRAGIEVADGRKSPEGTLRVQDAIIIGYSKNTVAGGSAADYCPNGGARGLVLPRTDYFWAENVIFHNYPETCMTAVETCSRCEYGPSSDSSGRTSYLKGIVWSNQDSATVTKRLRYNSPKKDIVYDFDGSFSDITPNVGDRYLTYKWTHLVDRLFGQGDDCPYFPSYDGLICNPGIRLRRVVFWSVGSVGSNDLRVLRVLYSSDLTEPFLVPVTRFSTVFYRYWRLPMGHWAFVTRVGDTYKYHWANGIDFQYLYFLRGDTFADTDFVSLVNNHTGPRESYDVTNYRTNGDVLTIASAPSAWQDALTLANSGAQITARKNGDWFHDATKNLFWLILKPSLNGTFYVYTYGCKLTCPIREPVYPVVKNDTTKRWCTPTDWTNNGLEVPNQGDFPVIESSWTMLLDCTTARVKIVMIYGTLIWEESGSYTFNAEAIWVLGRFLVGNSTVPFGSTTSYTATIQFNEGITAASLTFPVIDLNKAVLVTGLFAVYAKRPTIYRTYLTQEATKDVDSVLAVFDDVDWATGDEIFVESTLGTGKSEIHQIKSAPYTDSSIHYIPIVSKVSSTHWGAANALTYPRTASTVANVDYRARVALLSRKFTITAETKDNWGCRVYVTQYNGATFQARGTAILDSIELKYCGQANATVGAIEFQQLIKTSGATRSEFKNSVVRDSYSWLMIATSSNLVTVDNNFFGKATGGGIVLSGTFQDFKFTKNWVTAVGVATSNNPDFKYVHWDANFRADGARFTGTSELTENYFSDCGGHCASIGGGDCFGRPNGPWAYSNNLIKNGQNGLSFGGSGTICAGASDWTIYGIYETAVGTASNAQIVNVKNFVVLDAKYGFSLNTGGQEVVSVSLTESWIGGHANEVSFYTDQGYACDNKIGIIASTSSTRAKTLPIWGPTCPWRRQFLEGAWLNVARFTKNTYFNWFEEAQCKNNFVVSNNDLAQNSQAIHLFSESTVIGSTVPLDSVFTILPHESSASIIKRCGGWDCTGYLNVIFKDLDGTLTGTTVPDAQNGIGLTAFPLLKDVKRNYCDAIVRGGDDVGYTCKGRDWAILAFESLDLDRETRVFSPVNVTGDPEATFVFRNDLNAMMSQDDNYVDNWVRLARFYSVIQTNKQYNISYLGSLPNQLRFQLQGATFKEDQIVISQRYDQPYIIAVAHQKNGSVVRSSIRGPDGKADFTGQGCGANYYYGVDQIVQFRLTGAEDCLLTTTVTNGVKGKVRYAIDVNAFYANDGPTQFIDRVANVLGIPLSSVRIVSVTKGSTVVDLNVITQTQSLNPTPQQQEQIANEINGVISQLQTAIANGQLNILNSQVLDSSFSGSSVGNANGVYNKDDNSGVNPIYIYVAAGLGGLLLIIGAVIIVRRMKKKDENNVPNGFFDVKRNAKSPRKIGTRVFPLPKDLQSPSEKAPVIVDLESMADTNAPKVGTEMSQRKFLDSENAISPANNNTRTNLDARTKSRQQLKNPFE